MQGKKKKFFLRLILVVLVLALADFAINTSLIKPSWGSRLARLSVRYYLAPNFGAEASPEDTRTSMERMNKLTYLQWGTSVEKVDVKGMKAEWVRARNVPEESKNAVLYLHGGGFFSGSCNSHREVVSRISLAGKTAVLVPEYRLAPESKYPAANLDCLDAYLWLLQKGYDPAHIAIGGDSAGGCLTLMTLLSIRDQGYPMPAAAFLLSPLSDAVHFDGESFTTRAHADPWFKPEDMPKNMSRYTGGGTDLPSILSPLRNSLEGLPPMLIQVGRDEILLSDSTRLAERAKEAGVDASIEIWDDMWHVFQAFGMIVPEARQAIAHIGDFLQTRLPQS